MTKEVDLNQLSSEQLEQELKRRKQDERERKIREKEEYESRRNALVAELMREATILENTMINFKTKSMEMLSKFKEEADKYGDIKKTSKGGFSLRNSDTQEMVSLDRNSIPEYDERAGMAETLLKEFLEDTIKRKDLKTYRTISALMAKNKKGDYTPSRIAALLKIRDNYDDTRWVRAMQLFEESFQVRDISYSVSFYRKNALGKDVALKLTLASLDIPESNKEDDNGAE